MRISNDPQKTQLSKNNQERVKGWVGDTDSLLRFIESHRYMLESLEANIRRDQEKAAKLKHIIKDSEATLRRISK